MNHPADAAALNNVSPPVFLLMGRGGVQAVCHNLIKGYQQRGCLPTLVTFAGAEGRQGGVLTAAWQTFCWVHQHKSECALFVFGKEHFLMTRLACIFWRKRNKVGFFCASHTTKHIKHKSWFKRHLLRYAYRYALPTADIIIAQTAHMAEDLVITYNVANNLIHIVPPLVDMRFFEQRLVPPVDSKHVLYVGRLSPEKNLTDLIDGFTECAKRLPNIHLTFVGDGPERERLITYCAATGMADKVIFVGSQRDTLPYYLQGTIFTMTSIYEGFPLSLLEALACGRPAVVYDGFSGATEMIHPGENGYLVPQKNVKALAKALERALNMHWDLVTIRSSVTTYHPVALTEKFITALSDFVLPSHA